MKKSISFLMMLVVAVSMFGQSFKSNQLVGQWYIEMDQENAKGESLYSFNADGIGEAISYTYGQQPINGGTMIIQMPVYQKFEWSLSDNIISFKCIDFNLELTEENIDFICDDPKEKANFESQKAMMVQQLNNIIQAAAKSAKDFNTSMTIISLSDTELVAKDNLSGKVFDFTKVK